MGERMAKPPLIEALCEFRFEAGTPWDWAVPGQLFSRIADEFPDRAEVASFGVQIQGGPGIQPSATLATAPERIQFKRKDGTAMVQVGPNLLVINHLRPYPDWQTFRGLIAKIYEAYSSVTAAGPLARVGLRYINRINLPQGKADVGAFITTDPPLHGPLDGILNSFFQRYEILHSAPQGILVHQTGLQMAEGDRFIFVDLDFGSQPAKALNSSEAKELLDGAHERIEEAFIATLNPELYEKMRREAE